MRRQGRQAGYSGTRRKGRHAQVGQARAGSAVPHRQAGTHVQAGQTGRMARAGRAGMCRDVCAGTCTRALIYVSGGGGVGGGGVTPLYDRYGDVRLGMVWFLAFLSWIGYTI